MNGPRIVFMGTPEFGCAILNTLIKLEQNVVAVVCQPDKKVGRKQEIVFPVTKKTALEHDIPVIQPIKIREDYQEVLDYKPDLIITCAYGQIIPAAVLDYPKLGCINVHSSLLPKLRGGAPIQHAIIDGYTETGVTIMEMDRKMDSGAIISQASCRIDPEDTYGTLHDKLIEVAVKLLEETLPSVIDQTYVPIPQLEEEVTFGYNITKEEERLDLSKSYMEVYNRARGLIPAPCAYFMVDGKKVKIWDIKTSEMTTESANGTLGFSGNDITLAVDGRQLVIRELQLEGKQRMSARDFRNGAGRNWEGKMAE